MHLWTENSQEEYHLIINSGYLQSRNKESRAIIRIKFLKRISFYKGKNYRQDQLDSTWTSLGQYVFQRFYINILAPSPAFDRHRDQFLD